MRKQKFPSDALTAMKLVEGLEAGAMQRMLLTTTVAAHYQYKLIIEETGKPFDKLLLSDVVNSIQKTLHAMD
jgi:hypothetical protein